MGRDGDVWRNHGSCTGAFFRVHERSVCRKFWIVKVIFDETKNISQERIADNRWARFGELNREWQRYSNFQQRHLVACEIGLSAALLEGKLPGEMENRCVARPCIHG